MAFYSMAFLCFIVLFVFLHEIVGEFAPKYQWVIRLLAGISFFLNISGIKILFLLFSAFTIWGGALLIHRISDNNKLYRKTAELSKEEKKISKKNLTLQNSDMYYNTEEDETLHQQLPE